MEEKVANGGKLSLFQKSLHGCKSLLGVGRKFNFGTHRDVRDGLVADQVSGEVEVVLVLGASAAEQEVRQEHGEHLAVVVSLVAADAGTVGTAGTAVAADGLTPVCDVFLFGYEGLELRPPRVDAWRENCKINS